MPWLPSASLLAPLVPWFDRVRRDLPWRAADLDAPHPDPYAVLVSELMLQQTQVATVIPYFARWLGEFPDPETLAGAHEDRVHKAWAGLGYYRRARFLQAAAGAIAAAGWPGDLEGLANLPGLGPYTAAALGAIAFQWPTPALDGNAFRVLARLLLLEGEPRAQASALRTWLVPALKAHGPSRLTQALMELGAAVCRPSPCCGACPLSARCGAHREGCTGRIPPSMKRGKTTATDLWLVAFEAEGHCLLQTPAARGLLAGLWRWPALESKDYPPQPTAHGLPPITAWPVWTQVYTHRREAVSPLHIQLTARFEPGDGLCWVPRADLSGLPLGKRDQRLCGLLETEGQTPLEAPDPEVMIKSLSRQSFCED